MCSVIVTPGTQEALGGARSDDAFPQPLADEQLDGGALDVPRVYLSAQDSGGLLDGHAAFVGAVTGGQGVEDVGDRHEPGAVGDLVTGEPQRVTRAVELLVVGVGQLWHPLEVAGPGDDLEEVVGERDVGLDGPALFRV